MASVIDMYPPCPRPAWLKPGAQCYVWGEGNERFTVTSVIGYAATLRNSQGQEHGLESIAKLHLGLSHGLDE